MNFKFEVVGDGIGIDVFDWVGRVDTDGNVFPLVGIPDLVFVRKLPYAWFPERRRSASVTASWGRLCLNEGIVGDEFGAGGGTIGMFPHAACVPVASPSLGIGGRLPVLLLRPRWPSCLGIFSGDSGRWLDDSSW